MYISTGCQLEWKKGIGILVAKRFQRVLLGKAIQKYNLSFQLSMPSWWLRPMAGQQTCGQNNRGHYEQACKKSLWGLPMPSHTGNFKVFLVMGYFLVN